MVIAEQRGSPHGCAYVEVLQDFTEVAGAVMVSSAKRAHARCQANASGRSFSRRKQRSLVGQDKGKIILYDGGKTRVALPGHARTFVEKLIEQPGFLAQSALSWDAEYEWEDVEVVLRGLVELGLLERVGSRAT